MLIRHERNFDHETAGGADCARGFEQAPMVDKSLQGDPGPSQVHRGFDGQPPRGPDIFGLGVWHWDAQNFPSSQYLPGKAETVRDICHICRHIAGR